MTAQITPFPGTIAARNALSDPKTSPEARTAAKDLLWSASCQDYRRLTDAELAQSFPFIPGERFQRLRPAEQRGWMALRGWEIPVVGTAVLIAAYAGIGLIDLVIRALAWGWL